MAVIEDRKYQTDALDAVSDHWRAGRNRVLLVLPTGGGKSVLASTAIERAAKNPKRTYRSLFLAHRRNLIRQFAQRLFSQDIPYRVEMADAGSEEWVRRHHSPVVWVASKDTLLSRMGKGDWDDSIYPDLLYVDEAHRAEEEMYRYLLGKCPAKFWMGLTATPIRPDGSGLGSHNWDCIVRAETYAGLVAGQYLCPIRVYAPPGVCRRRAEGKKVRVSGDPVDQWMRHARGKRTIAFLPNVATAHGVAEKFRLAGVPSAVLSAKSTNDERSDVMGKVKDGRILWLGNVDLFTEGMDCPELEVCQILKMMESLRAMIQAVGRVSRPAPWIGKEYGILLDHVGASALHGYPALEPEWRLDESGAEFERRHRARVEKELGKPVDCRKCGAVFAGRPKCPYCGEAIPVSKKKVELVFDEEGLAPAGAKVARPISREQREWDRVLWRARHGGLTCGAAFQMFKRKMKMTPQEAGVRPLFGYQQRDVPVGIAEDGLRSYSRV